MIVSVNNDAIGMYLFEPIYFKNILLIADGVKLKKSHIDRLIKMGIQYISATHSPIYLNESTDTVVNIKDTVDLFMNKYIMHPFTGNNNNSVTLSEDNIDIKYNEFKNSIKKSPRNLSIPSSTIDNVDLMIKEEFDIYVKLALLKLSNYLNKDEAIIKIINKINYNIANNKHYSNLFLDLKSIDSFTYTHSINVLVTSLLIGKNLGFSSDELYTLAVGALFHDIGKIKVSKDILFSSDICSEAERVKVEQHAIEGYEYLSRLTVFPQEVSYIALEHHERLNGSGYPYQLKNDEIHPISMIVGISDIYDSMTTTRQYRKAHTSKETLELLLASGDILFDHTLVKAFLSVIEIYRLGGIVQLSTNECGLVVKQNYNLPARPVLKVIYDKRGLKIVKDRIIDLSLSENCSISIIRVLD